MRHLCRVWSQRSIKPTNFCDKRKALLSIWMVTKMKTLHHIRQTKLISRLWSENKEHKYIMKKEVLTVLNFTQINTSRLT